MFMNKSMYQVIKRQNGEAFAKKIRKFDSGIFEIENLPDILKYAGRNPEPLLEYLESLKKVQIIESVTDENPFSLLDKAGYNAFVADTLEKQNAISKYFEKEEMICTFGDAQRYQNYYIIHAVKKNVDEIKRKDFLHPKREDAYGRSVISIQILKSGGFIKITNRYNHTVDHPDNTFYSNPDEIIYGLSGALRQYFGVDFSSNKMVLLPEGYFLFHHQILKYYQELNNTYFGQVFYLKEGVLTLIDKNFQMQVDEFIVDLKNKEILNPCESKSPLKDVLEQEILNETLQVKNNKGVLSLFSSKGEILKVQEGCLKELTLHKTRNLPAGFLNKHSWIEKVTAPLVETASEACLVACPKLQLLEMEKLKHISFDFCAETRCKVKAPCLEEEGFKFFDTLVFDLKNKRFATRGYFSKIFIDVLNRTISLKPFSFQKEGDKSCFLLDSKPFLVFKGNDLSEIYFEWYFKKFDLSNVFSYLPDLEVFSSKGIEVLGGNNLIHCPKLKYVYLDNVIELMGRNLSSCESLEYVYAPELLVIGRSCFSNNKNYKKARFEKLYRAQNADCFSNSGYEELELPNLVYAGRNFCSNNLFLKKALVLNMKSLGEYSFSNLEAVEELSFSSLQYIEGRNLIQNNPCLKRVYFDKLMNFPNLCLKNCPLVEEVYLNKVYRLDGFSLSEKKNLKHLYVPELAVIDQKFLNELPVDISNHLMKEKQNQFKVVANQGFCFENKFFQLEREG